MRDPRFKPSRKELDSRIPGTVRVANGSFFNSSPYSSLKEQSCFEYLEDVPAECARKLHEQECDVALIPVAEALAYGDYKLFPYGIVAPGKVDTVLLLSQIPIEEITTVEVDIESSTSVLLLKTLLPIKQIKRSYDEIIEEAESCLLIGDKAYRAKSSFSYCYDLGEMWAKKTGLPFVFAVWAARRGVMSDETEKKFLDSMEIGLSNKARFAEHWLELNGVPAQETTTYLNETISYRLDQKALSGLSEFCEIAGNKNLVPPASRFQESKRTIDAILQDAINRRRISAHDALMLGNEGSLADLSAVSDALLNPTNEVSYIVDRNVNHTNVCNVYCRFCAFYRAPGSEESYLLTKKQLGKKIQETVDAGGIQILLQGGLHPDLKIEWFEELFTWIKSNYPINLHALSSDEIWYIAKVSNISISETIRRLIDAGLGSLPGAGAELLVDRVRHKIARLKTSAAEWLNVHRLAHMHGITSTCTMMFGVGETWEDRISHFHKLRNLQDQTGGFTAFISWPFQHENTSLQPGDTSAPEYLRVQALSRIFLDNIKNIQSSWVTQGPNIGQISLFYGANDFGSTMFEENVVSAAGTTYCMNADFIEETIAAAGFEPWRRDVHYNRVG